MEHCLVIPTHLARRDALRRHYKACPSRGQNVEIPLAKRGRPRRACDTCRSQKIQCDGKCPCNRCSLSQARCSYESRGPRPVGLTPYHAVSQNVATNKVYCGTSYTDICPVPFLLNYTNPEFESITYAFAASDALAEPLLELNEDDSYSDSFGQTFCHGPAELTVQNRAEDLITVLIDHHHSSLSQNTTEPSLILSTASRLFKPRSIIHYISTYFDYFHPHFRFIHRPTFDILTVSLPLLLAATLVGSTQSPPTDDALSAHILFGLAEDYIFTYLQKTCAMNIAATEDVVQAIQAAGLISAMLYASDHPPAVRLESHQRIPRLVASLRSLGLMDGRRTAPIHHMSWRQFISEETRIRQALSV